MPVGGGTQNAPIRFAAWPVGRRTQTSDLADDVRPVTKMRLANAQSFRVGDAGGPVIGLETPRQSTRTTSPSPPSSPTLGSRRLGSALVNSSPAPTVRRATISEVVPKAYGHDKAKDFKESVPKNYGNNKVVVETISLGHPDAARLGSTSKSVPNPEMSHPEIPAWASAKTFPHATQTLPHATHAVVQSSTARVVSSRQPSPLLARRPGMLGQPAPPSPRLCGRAAMTPPHAHFSRQATMGSCRVPIRPSVPEKNSPVRLVVFDFDCTLSAFHVFASLAGMEKNSNLPMPPPQARTERGQVRRLEELDADPNWGPGVFALKAFGGIERVAQLRKALVALAQKDVKCIVCSRGLVGPIRKLLDQLSLLHLFSHILGNIGNHYGALPYDDEVANTADVTMSQEHYFGTEDMDVRGAGASSKSEAIANYVKARGLECSQAIFLDDDSSEFKGWSARRIHVAGDNGIRGTELQLLHEMVDASLPREKVSVDAHATVPGIPGARKSTGDTSLESSCEEASEASKNIDDYEQYLTKLNQSAKSPGLRQIKREF